MVHSIATATTKEAVGLGQNVILSLLVLLEGQGTMQKAQK